MKKILITGATGYIGGLLLDSLASKGYCIRAMVRHPENLVSKLSNKNVEVVQADVLSKELLNRALDGIDVAFYLVHSMGASYGSFEQMDRLGAHNFAQAAVDQGVKRIVYLGGLGHPQDGKLSTHMKSRQEVGQILCSYNVQVVEFRASIILGPGSLSYELMRALVEKLPIMVAPKWVNCLTQPIYVEDVLQYLEKAIDIEEKHSLILEIGGRDIISYKELMLEYARQKSLKRTIFIVPVLTPTLSSMWLALVTPIYKRIGRKLIDSIMNDSIVKSESHKELFSLAPIGFKEALKLCIQENKKIKRRWFDAISSKGVSRDFTNVAFKKRQIFLVEELIAADPSTVFSTITSLGGKNGWYADFFWKARGIIDLLIGGVGYRRGKPEERDLSVGDAIDFWRVVKLKKDELFILKAEMKLPGRAFLSFEIFPKQGKTLLVMESIFDPIGFLGLLYWYSTYPFHVFIFPGLVKRIKKASEAKTLKR